MKRMSMLLLPIALILSSVILSQTCRARSVPPEERNAVREEVDQRAVEIVSAMKQEYEHKLAMNSAVSGGYGVNAIPWLKQIQKVFACGLAGHNGRSLNLP